MKVPYEDHFIVARYYIGKIAAKHHVLSGYGKPQTTAISLKCMQYDMRVMKIDDTCDTNRYGLISVRYPIGQIGYTSIFSSATLCRYHVSFSTYLVPTSRSFFLC